jgi:putative transposase
MHPIYSPLRIIDFSSLEETPVPGFIVSSLSTISSNNTEKMNKKSEIPSKRRMPRPRRLQFEGAFYHVYNRGNRRERLFHTRDDYREFEAMLLDFAERHHIKLYQWRLMPNHFHFLLETPEANLAVFMHRLLSTYARYFNRTHRQVGHVFQSRYGAKLCDKESYLLELIRYIALNAHRARNWEKLVENGEAEWSSHRYYLNGEEPLTVRPWIHEVLRRFSEDLPTARRRYAEFIAEGLADQKAAWSLPKGRYLGNERFIEESKRKANQPVRQEARSCPATLDQLIQRVWEMLKVTEAELQSHSQDRRITAARKALVYVAKKYGYRSTELAVRLKKRLSSISQMYRSQENHREDPLIQTLLIQTPGDQAPSCG